MNTKSHHLDNILNKKDRVGNLQIVFADIEKYSQRRTVIQSKLIDQFTKYLTQALTEVSKEYVDYAADNNIHFARDTIILPAGDGAAVVFSFDGLHDIHLNYAKALLKQVYDNNQKNECDEFVEKGWCDCHLNFNLRIGISEGKGLIYTDVRGGYNVAGDVINMAARVMNIVAPNQITFTKQAWREVMNMIDDPSLPSHFVKYPGITLKHGVQIDVYQYVNDKLKYLNSEPLRPEDDIEQYYGFMERHREIERSGFRRIYSDRQEFFNDLFGRILLRTRQELKIMGICVSLFREMDRPPRVSSEWGTQRLIENIAEAMVARTCTYKVLFLKRYPNLEELKRYGISKRGDFFLMRERDEDPDYNFQYGKRLKKIANRSIGCWIQILIELAERTKNMSPQTRTKVLSRLQVREYIALPSLSLYIADGEIYITPYVLKRHCSTVPVFQITGKDTTLYRAYNGHFESAWTDKEFTTAAIDERFIQLLGNKPKETLKLYRKKYEKIGELEEAKARHKQIYKGDPEYYRVEEKTIEAILAENKL